MRKSILFLLCCILTLSFSVFVGCGGGKKQSESEKESQSSTAIELVDFEDKTEEVEIGTTYYLNNVVTDIDENDYQVSYAVVTGAGETVVVDSYELDVTDISGYVITCTALIAEGNVTRTITLTVKDTTAPVVTFGKVKEGYLDVEYVLPEITVTDTSTGGSIISNDSDSGYSALLVEDGFECHTSTECSGVEQQFFGV